MTEPDTPDPPPPVDHGRLPDNHPILADLAHAAEVVRRINAHRRKDTDEQA